MKIIALVSMAATVFCSATVADEPYGLAAMQRLDRLPYLSSGTSAGQQSSYDRTGGNGDAGNFLYTDANGEHVMLDLKAPGCVYCIWTTGFNGTDLVKAYIDGETTPRVNMTITNLFAGTNTPFLTPLAGNSSVSSGGFYSYVPIPFASSIKITTTGSSYYHVGYQTYMPNTAVTSWNSSSSVDTIQKIWKATGSDPKPSSTATAIVDSFTLGAGQTQTLFDVNGPGEIVSIRMHIPTLGNIGDYSSINTRTVTDNGRAFKGYCQFTVAINPANQGIRLKRRLDYGIANQIGSVAVDGPTVGNWSTMGSDGTNGWRDSSFIIPSSYTAGKSSITIKISFVSSSVDWNEFYYWVYNELSGGTESISDSLDVGTVSSESAHSYTINTQTWSGTNTETYPSSSNKSLTDTLDSIHLKIFWDNETTPSVDAPIGSFFAMGQFGSFATSSLMLGVDSSNNLYCFFPMPFAHHATIQLSSTSTAAFTNVSSQVRYSSFSDPFNYIGYFKTHYNHVLHNAGDNTDVLFLDTTGSGKFLGVIESMRGGTTSRGYLEGDERIYVDNNRSPAYHGTGTEDFYNGGWYFQNGPFTLPMQGNTVHTSDTSDKTAAYRFLFQDAVDFRTHIHASKEHGDRNGQTEEDWVLAYYYLNPQLSSIQTDSVDAGKASSESAHSFAVDSLTWTGSLTSSFEGINDGVSVTDSGRSNRGNCAFTVAIQKSNNGVILRRMFKQTDTIQKADVSIDGSLVGTWYHAGRNTTHQWREDEFSIPPSFTYGKGQISVVLTHAAGTPDWNAFKYTVFSLTDTVSGTTALRQRTTNNLVSPVNIPERCIVSIFTVDGRLIKKIDFSKGDYLPDVNKVCTQSLPAGAYVYRITSIAAQHVLKTGRVMAY